MARTTTKKITFQIEDATKREAFLKQLQSKLNFVDLQILFKNPNINITVRGARERVLYAINLIKKIFEDIRSEV